MRRLALMMVLLAAPVSAADTEQWGLHEISLPGPSTGNPFVDAELFATFTQGNTSVRVGGFYDGDGMYHVRFMPPTVGEWKYTTASNKPQLNAKTGSFTVGLPKVGNRGPVRVHNTFHFAYADGTPYRPVGTTCYAWTHQPIAMEEQTLATLKAAPFNKLRMCVFPKWYAANRVEPPRYPFVGSPPNKWDFDRFNPEFFRHLETRVGQLRDLGIEADLILFHPYDEGHWGFDRMPPAVDDRYLRYVVARLGAFRNVWWSLANEFDFMKEKRDSDWERYLTIVHEADPYRHLCSIHNGTRLFNQTDRRLTHASVQNGSAVADFGRAVLYRDVYEKPIVLDEVKYEGDFEQRWGNLSAEEMVHRCWVGTVAGCYVGHGETYQHPRDEVWWARGGLLHGKSAERLALLRKVLEDAPATGIDPIDKWQDDHTAGRHGDYYLVYLGKDAPTEWPVDLPGKKLPPFAVTAEVLDAWSMTITPVSGTFTLSPKGGYRMAAGLSIPLPGKPFQAIRLRVVKKAGPGPRVDVNPDMARADILSPGWDNWRVPDGSSATAMFGGVEVTLRAKAGKLAGGWWKPGFDHPARMASDGVTANGLEVVLRGLTPGRHSLATFHNALGDKTDRVRVSTTGFTTEVTPASRVTHDADAASAFVEFTAEAGKDVVVSFDGPVTLNGFEIDRPDPARRANKPTPADDDEHAPDNPVLTWKPVPGTTAYRVFLGESPETLVFQSETAEPRFPTAGLTSTRSAFWRVDTVSPAGVVPGEVWRFRVRHLAFPEAEGYGRFAIGGRGGRVIEVTNLNDSGSGSLREAVEASGPRTVVFRVGGRIELKSKLVIRHPYLTVAGQTAPGDGICVSNYTFGCSDTHDVIVRHVRIRVGDESGLTQDGCGARGSDHVIYDHCSISWSIDEGFSSREARNITVQRCLIAEALNIADHKKYQPGKGHSFAASISGNVGSFHHNLLAHCTGRNWSLAGGLDRTGAALAGRLDIRNNVVFNWRDRTTDGGVRGLNFVGNTYLPGPATNSFTLLKPDPGDPTRGMRAFMTGNVIEGKPDIAADNWSAYVGPADGQKSVRSEEPLFEPFVHTQSATETVASVLLDVGANRPRPDAVDRRILADVRRRGHTFTGSRGKLPGIIDSPKDAGGFPAYQSGPVPVDTDHDGIPDVWEAAHALNPKNPADGAAFRHDGYTQLEAYLNELAAPDPYLPTAAKRAATAVQAVGAIDAETAERARASVAHHYTALNRIHTERDAAVMPAKAANDTSAVLAVRKVAEAAVHEMHTAFLVELTAVLTPEQAEAVKDRMVYDVRPLTLKAYRELLPKMTDAHFAHISKLLLAGRDAALVAGSSTEKHETFGRAKGRVVNYLSGQGFDLKAAERALAAKKKADKK